MVFQCVGLARFSATPPAPSDSLRVACCVGGASSSVREEDVDSALRYLDDKRLIWVDGDLVFGLAVLEEQSREREATEWAASWPAIYV